MHLFFVQGLFDIEQKFSLLATVKTSHHEHCFLGNKVKVTEKCFLYTQML